MTALRFRVAPGEVMVMAEPLSWRGLEHGAGRQETVPTIAPNETDTVLLGRDTKLQPNYKEIDEPVVSTSSHSKRYAFWMGHAHRHGAREYLEIEASMPTDQPNRQVCRSQPGGSTRSFQLGEAAVRGWPNDPSV